MISIPSCLIRDMFIHHQYQNMNTEMFTLRASIYLLCRVAFGQMISSIKGLTELSDGTEALWQ